MTKSFYKSLFVFNKSKKSKKRTASLISVTPQPPNTITLDDATEYISTLPQDEQKTFYNHLNQILIKLNGYFIKN